MMSWPYELCPNIVNRLQAKKVLFGQYTIIWSRGCKYQVDGGKWDQYIVDLDKHTCSCKELDLSGIPCAHGIAVEHYKGGKPIEENVKSCYSIIAYLRAHDNLIQPINGRNP